MGSSKLAIKRALKVQKYSKIDKNSANFMLQNLLLMRNSNMKQVISRHYGRGIYPESHGVGVDYSVPLWTIAIKDLHVPKKDWLSLQDSDRIKTEIDKYDADCYKYFREHLGEKTPKYPFSTSFLSASEKELDEHFSNYINRIKKFIRSYAPFSPYLGSPTFDYELLISQGSSMSVDDHGRYSTGGRSHGTFNAKTIDYRVTLNEVELEFLKSIMRGTKDDNIPAIKQCRNDNVKKTVRRALCNELATDIIVAKLINWLNCLGNCKQVFTLDKTDLNLLLDRSMKTRKADIDEITEKDYLHSEYSDPKYLDTSKNDDRLFTHQFRKLLKAQQDKTWYYSVIGRSFWSEKQPDTLREILEHACKSRTTLGYRNRSFEVCQLLGWLDDKGQLTEAFSKNVTMSEAYDVVNADSAKQNRPML
jgi:hypothetical protein